MYTYFNKMEVVELAKGINYESHIQARIPVSDYEIICEYCEKEGKKISDFIRETIKEKAESIRG